MKEAKKIFQFLKAFHELNNPVITELATYSRHINISNLPQIDEIRSIFNGSALSDNTYIDVKKPDVSECPPPGDDLIKWIEGDWKNIYEYQIQHHEFLAIERTHSQGHTYSEREEFTADGDRVNKYRKWLIHRKLWQESQLPKHKGLELYNTLFALYSQLQIDVDRIELVIGDGILLWQIEERIINHPILLHVVKLEFDAEIPSIRVCFDDTSPRLYKALLRTLPSINQKVLSSVMDDFGTENIDLINSTRIPLYKRLVNTIDTNGAYADSSPEISRNAAIFSEPVLFVRKRNQGFSHFIDSILTDIENTDGANIPFHYKSLIGQYEQHDWSLNLSGFNPNGIDKDILLTLPANKEQLGILKALEKNNAVMVQGPPGTGKTHTIANVIGHLVSEGKSVLVTSQTEKALHILKDKVYADKIYSDINLQNFCLSLSSNNSNRKEMDAVINEIASKTGQFDVYELDVKISELVEERELLFIDLDEAKQKLVKIRSVEYDDIVFNNETFTPADASKFIRNSIGVYDYIAGKSANTSIAYVLSEDDLNYLYESNKLISKIEENLLSFNHPNHDDLISIDDFEDIVSAINTYKSQKVEIPGNNSANDINESSDFLEHYELSNSYIDELSSLTEFEIALFDQFHITPSEISIWKDILGRFDNLQNYYETYRRAHLEHDYEYVEEVVSNESLMILNNIVESNREKPVSIFSKKSWKVLRDSVVVDNKPIELLEDYRLLRDIFKYEYENKCLYSTLNKMLSSYAFQYDLTCENLDKYLKQKRPFIERVVDFYESKLTTYQNIISIYLKEADVLNIHTHQDLLHALRNVRTFLEYKKSNHQLNAEQDRLNRYALLLSSYENAFESIARMKTAVGKLDIETYSATYKEISFLLEKEDIFNRRKQLMAHIKEVAPDYAAQIRSRIGIHSEWEVPEHYHEAWKCFQLRNILDELNTCDPNELQNDVNLINEKILRNARELAYYKAWLELLKKQTPEVSQALNGWRDIIKQIGKGTGKNAPRLHREARSLISKCQKAIPVWIMPMYNVFENFIASENQFDVVIIDEASQSNVLALAVLYMGKKVIVVGDDEQVSPSSVGINTDEVNALIEQHLDNIPLKTLYNGQSSLYDLAKRGNFKQITLLEHFRCLTEIIQFCNNLSYNGQIKPLRDGSGLPIKPAFVNYRVSGGLRSEGKAKINKVEALHIVSLIKTILEIDEYRDQTIGVISLVGREQAEYINSELQSLINPKEYLSRNIQCGSPDQFQGDERDIIFLTMVDSPKEGGGPLRLVSPDGNNDQYRKRYNVAVSRARNQVWLVHSLNPEIDLKPSDIRYSLIKHANEYAKKDYSLIAQGESHFEKEVIKYLSKRGFDINPQYPVGAYRIDMVLSYKDKRIALECDGEKYHIKANLEDDMQRQAILERLGWRFIRIRGSEFYRNPDTCIERVVEQLADFDIFPQTKIAQHSDSEVALITKVKQKAETFRQEKLQLNSQRKKRITVTPVSKKKDVSTPDQVDTIKAKPIAAKSVAVPKASSQTSVIKAVSNNNKSDANNKTSEKNTKVDKPMFDFS